MKNIMIRHGEADYSKDGLTVIQTEERDPGVAWFRVRAVGEVAHLLSEGEPISDSGFKG